MWIHNPDWKIITTISFVDGYSGVLTYTYHDGGWILIHIHCCRNRTNISSSASDQVCHSVIKTWTVKNMKVGYNSTGYQMVEQRSS